MEKREQKMAFDVGECPTASILNFGEEMCV